MKFIDEAKIFLKAGDGGNGCVSFRREKYVPRGGPDGGNGGRGGHIIFVGDSGLTTLMDFKHNRHIRGDNGQHGKGKTLHGRMAEDTVLSVPLGTQVYDNKTGGLICDITEVDQKEIIAKGGDGGRGNATFSSSIRQSPKFAQEGVPGEEIEIRMELKLIADVGLIGLPNAGKSTFLSVVSNAHPKVADYPFTTLSPSLGVVKRGYFEPFVIADLPGLIEGAHHGKGMGDQFLKHCERTKMYLHLVSLSPDEELTPWERFEKIQLELQEYDEKFSEKTFFVLLTKTDLVLEEELEEIQKEFQDHGFETFPICSLSKDGLDVVLEKVAEVIQK